MEPYFFESNGDDIFGAYHPASDIMSRRAIVICAPLYQEYFRTYRLLAKLAERWASSGYHVLRFDYFGTGDSSGDAIDGGPKRWAKDIRAAVSELMGISGADEVTLAGVRFGATLAIMSAATIDSVKSVSMWDPVWDGRDYLELMQNAQRNYIHSRRKLSDKEKLDAVMELGGFDAYPWLESELQEVSLTGVGLDGIERIGLVVSESERPEQREFEDYCRAGSVRIDSSHVDSDCDWYGMRGKALQVPELTERFESCLK